MAQEVRRFDPPRAVLVLHADGLRYRGWCERMTIRADGTRLALCRYTTEPGMTYVRWVHADRFELLDD